ncbi:hypothetical protein FOHLNKBM_5810 [Methylobacterium longum]|nr:hypothetical protein FOHLNKBM_5810 [Methylobacterium longum]
MRVVLLAVLLVAGLSHYAWFARTMDEAELAQAEAAEVGTVVPIAVSDTD